MKWTGTKDIKWHLKQVLLSKDFMGSGKKALDFPSGNGVSLQVLQEAGYAPVGADLFPELNRFEGATVLKADLSKPLPFESDHFDLILCQEGIEHVGNQDFVFNELSRILKLNGRLLMTTPNYSSLKSRMSYLLTESEAFGRIMPANEVDSIWLSGKNNDLYFGHVFLTGFLRLRLFGLLSGLDFQKLHPARLNYTSLFLFPLLYPFILFFSFKTYRRFVRKTRNQSTGREVFKHMIDPKLLLQGHLILEFKKSSTPKQAVQRVQSDNNVETMTT